MTALNRTTLPLLYLLLAACTATAPGRQQSVDHFVQVQKSEARQLQAQDRLAEALAVWRTLLPLEIQDPEVTDAVASLQTEIARRVDDNLRRARAAQAQGDHSTADLYMLRALALQPGQAQALVQLATNQSQRAQRQQENKSNQEYRQVAVQQQRPAVSLTQRLRALNRQGDHEAMLVLGETAGEPPPPDVAGLMRLAHVSLADQAEQRGQFDTALAHMQSAMALQPRENDSLLSRSAELRKQLSEDWYRAGTRLMKNDLPQAITALKKSLGYNPYNQAARRKLAQAETLQRNLEKIQQRS